MERACHYFAGAPECRANRFCRRKYLHFVDESTAFASTAQSGILRFPPLQEEARHFGKEKFVKDLHRLSLLFPVPLDNCLRQPLHCGGKLETIPDLQKAKG
ncbi:MAG: hypothetical protein IRZ03_08655 [Acidobacterium ailaaui]|nr:hypothetical protein [Pseudacidobacterium ailaaui]